MVSFPISSEFGRRASTTSVYRLPDHLNPRRTRRHSPAPAARRPRLGLLLSQITPRSFNCQGLSSLSPEDPHFAWYNVYTLPIKSSSFLLSGNSFHVQTPLQSAFPHESWLTKVVAHPETRATSHDQLRNDRLGQCLLQTDGAQRSFIRNHLTLAVLGRVLEQRLLQTSGIRCSLNCR